MPAEDFVLGNEDVRVAIAVEVNEFQVRIPRVEIWERAEWAETFPAEVIGAFVEAAHRAFESDEVLLTVTGKVHELRVASKGSSRFGGDEFDRSETGFDFRRAVAVGFGQRTQVALIKPSVRLFRENTRNAFAVEI